MSQNPEISIIIPCYNSEAYLQRCLDSVVNQTYKNIEIIIVDDGSTDNTIEIINSYASKDNRIVVVNITNVGVSMARNIGISKVNGKYIMFVDSDDWIDLESCGVALSEIKKHNADVLMWPYIQEFSNKSYLTNIFNQSKIIFDELDVKNKLYRRLLGLLGDELSNPENMDRLNPVWAKMYRTKLIKDYNILFIDLSIIGTGEDVLFNLEVFNQAKKVVYINKPFYHYLRTNSDSCTTIYKSNLYTQWQQFFKIMINHIKSNRDTKENYQALSNRIAYSIVGLGLNICQSKKSHLEKINEIKEIVSSKVYRKLYKSIELKYFPIYWKIFFLCAKHKFATGLYIQLCVINRIIR